MQISNLRNEEYAGKNYEKFDIDIDGLSIVGCQIGISGPNAKRPGSQYLKLGMLDWKKAKVIIDIYNQEKSGTENQSMAPLPNQHDKYALVKKCKEIIDYGAENGMEGLKAQWMIITTMPDFNGLQEDSAAKIEIVSYKNKKKAEVEAASSWNNQVNNEKVPF